MEQKEQFHGSDLEKIEKIFGIKKEDIISFSANVNPLGISYDLKKNFRNTLMRLLLYPDREYTDHARAIATISVLIIRISLSETDLRN